MDTWGVPDRSGAALTGSQCVGRPFRSVLGGGRRCQSRPLLYVMTVLTFPPMFWFARKTPFTPLTCGDTGCSGSSTGTELGCLPPLAPGSLCDNCGLPGKG